MTTCRRRGCSNDADGTGDAHRGAFCSDFCEVKHDHIKADAQDARRADERGHSGGRW